MYVRKRIMLRGLLLALLLVATVGSAANAVVYNLHTGRTDLKMPDGVDVAMWGFAQDTAPFAGDGTVTVPGPVLEVPDGDTQLVINLLNNLNEPVSLIIPGLPSPMNAVWDDGAKRFRTKGNYTARVQSFDKETAAAGGSVQYVWNNVKPGTYLYLSGTDPAKQVQMGLYGAVKADARRKQAYAAPMTAYDREVVLLFSEVDPVMHQAIVNGTYVSPLKHEPKYFLINGQAFNPRNPQQSVINAGNAAGTTLVRFLSASLEIHIPVLLGPYMNIVGEDGNACPFPKEQYSLDLAPQKRFETLIQAGTPGTYPLFDRRLNLSNDNLAPGGMLVYLDFK